MINKLSGDGFDEEEDAKRLSIAAFICGMALESDLFLADSQRDKFTELKNRLGFYDDCKKFLRKPPPLSIIICDIDFFKKVNDTYGHNAGDAILIHVSKILAANVRECDGAYRWGGEEFILILDGANLAKAANVAESIRQAVEKSFCSFGGDEIRVTMSFGYAEISSALSIEENVKIADARLYRAKRSDRNKVISRDE